MSDTTFAVLVEPDGSHQEWVLFKGCDQDPVIITGSLPVMPFVPRRKWLSDREEGA